MDIYQQLLNKTHNKHYMNRYIKFIKSRNTTSGNRHHICPKAKDLFPEFKSFKEYPDNRCILTDREHYIAHWLLWKIYGGSQTVAFFRMGKIRSSKIYESILKDVRTNHSKFMKRLASTNSLYIQSEEGRSNMSKTMTDRNLKLSAIGKHPMQQLHNKIAQSSRIKATIVISLANGTHSTQKSKEEKEIIYEKIRNKQILNGNSGNICSQKLTKRENVIELREIFKFNNIKPGRNWWMKSDDWINSKISDFIHE